MTAPTDTAPARPAEKGANTGADPALVRIAVNAIVALTGERRKSVRAWIRTLTEAEIRTIAYADPTGERATGNVHRDADYAAWRRSAQERDGGERP